MAHSIQFQCYFRIYKSKICKERRLNFMQKIHWRNPDKWRAININYRYYAEESFNLLEYKIIFTMKLRRSGRQRPINQFLQCDYKNWTSLICQRDSNCTLYWCQFIINLLTVDHLFLTLKKCKFLLINNKLWCFRTVII